jgi:hypothetical protein
LARNFVSGEKPNILICVALGDGILNSWERVGKRKNWVSKSSEPGNMKESVRLAFSWCLPCLLLLVAPSSAFWLTWLYFRRKRK